MFFTESCCGIQPQPKNGKSPESPRSPNIIIDKLRINFDWLRINMHYDVQPMNTFEVIYFRTLISRFQIVFESRPCRWNLAYNERNITSLCWTWSCKNLQSFRISDNNPTSAWSMFLTCFQALTKSKSSAGTPSEVRCLMIHLKY